MKKILTAATLILATLFLSVRSAEGSPLSKGVTETVEFFMRKWTKEVTREGVGATRKRLEKLAAQYGDDALVAARKTGPDGIRAMEKAGEHGDVLVRALAVHGSKGLAAAASPKSVALISRYGDDAASAIIRHPRIAEPVIEAYGHPAAAAMKQLSSGEGIFLAKMAKCGELAQIGRSEVVLGVIEKYGDPAMNFIWRNKGALMTGTVLTAFLVNPEPFIQGGSDLGGKALDTTANVMTKLAKAVAERVCWTPVVLIVFGILCLFLWRRFPRLRPSHGRAAISNAASSGADSVQDADSASVTFSSWEKGRDL